MCQGIIQASGLVYGQLASAAEVAAYFLALRVATLISQFCQAPFYSKLPRLAELQSAGNLVEQLRLTQRGMRVAYWVFALGAVAVALSADRVLHLIGSRTQFVSPGVWAVLALAYFAERFGAMHLQLYSLTNHIVWHIANGVSGSS
jgi:O-antigen/teichoic acid export membrane protein